jgi:hypothetical protein
LAGLVAFLGSHDIVTQRYAARALANLSMNTDEICTDLAEQPQILDLWIALVEEQGIKVRSNVAHAISRLATVSDEIHRKIIAQPELLERLNDLLQPGAKINIIIKTPAQSVFRLFGKNLASINNNEESCSMALAI